MYVFVYKVVYFCCLQIAGKSYSYYRDFPVESDPLITLQTPVYICSVSNTISAGDDVLQPEVLQMLAEIHKGVYAIEAQPNNKTWQDGICKT